jgi:hypothetical protein
MTAGTRQSTGDLTTRRVVRMLRDGYWEKTEIVELGDGSLRVRKSSKGGAPPGPWGVSALRKEIQYLSTLPAEAAPAFPPLLETWDDDSVSSPLVGYEVPFYDTHVDAGRLARDGALTQAEVDEFQDALASVVFDRVHAPSRHGHEPLSSHVRAVVEHALNLLSADAELAPLIRAESVRLNGEAHAGARASFARALADGRVIAALDGEPQVRLHGDLFLENILWRRTEDAARPRLVLIDPVSVAGVTDGPPLFDLVKYESYATGELLALRCEWVDVTGFGGDDEYSSRVRWAQSELEPFEHFDWHTRFRRAFEAKYGPVDGRAYRLMDGYFSVAMAVNTSGVQRRARLLKAILDFNAAGYAHP